MTEPTRPLTDGPSDAAAGLEPLPDPVAPLWIVLGPVPGQLLPGRAAGRALLNDLHRLAATLGAPDRPLRPEEIGARDLERVNAELARGPLRLEGALAITLLPLWRSLTADALRIVVAHASLGELRRRALEQGERPEVALAQHERELRLLLLGARGLDVEILGPEPLSDGDWETATVPTEIVHLHELVSGLVGRHRSFAPPAPGAESASGPALLGLHAELAQAAGAISYLAGELETVLAVKVTREPLRILAPGSSEEEEELVEPTEDGRYPLDASQDRAAYHRWLHARHEPVVLAGAVNGRSRAATRAPRRGTPLLSLLVPVFNSPRWALERCVASVLAQSDGSWELCLVDDGSGDPELTNYLTRLPRIDRRIRVGALASSQGISAATNAAFALASGGLVGYLDHDDELAPQAVASVRRALEAHPDAELLYSDEDKIDENGERFDPLFKPEWSPDLLLSFAYTCHLTVVRRELARRRSAGCAASSTGARTTTSRFAPARRRARSCTSPRSCTTGGACPARPASGAAAKPWAYEAGRRAIADAMERRGELGGGDRAPQLPRPLPRAPAAATPPPRLGDHPLPRRARPARRLRELAPGGARL